MREREGRERREKEREGRDRRERERGEKNNKITSNVPDRDATFYSLLLLLLSFSRLPRLTLSVGRHRDRTSGSRPPQNPSGEIGVACEKTLPFVVRSDAALSPPAVECPALCFLGFE